MGMLMCKDTKEQKDSGSSLHDNPSNSGLNAFLIHGYGRSNWQQESLKCDFIREATKTLVPEITHRAHALDFQGEVHTH